MEYQRFAFTTYQVLSGEAAKVQPSMAVLEAERLAEEFVEELRILLNNIKGKMEQVSAQTSLQDVLSHHFVEYRADIVDRSYHRLKTSDHVSRYRIRILQEVQEIQQNKERMRALCDECRTPSACRLGGGCGISHERIAADDRGDLSGA